MKIARLVVAGWLFLFGMVATLRAGEAPPKVVDTVVIVPDGPSYLAALSGWSASVRYPVLIDDGSYAAGQDVARFVRAFTPASVVRFTSADGVNTRDPEVLSTAAQRTVMSAWGASDAAGLTAAWKSRPELPAGIVLFDASDSAWPGAVALAAGRGQVLLRWTRPKGWPQVWEALTLTQARELMAIVEGTFKGWMPDQSRPKAMRAVTLAMNVPVAVTMREGDIIPGAGPMQCKVGEAVALTDLIGRFTQGASISVGRFCVAGQLPGTEAQSAYRAMCSMFLTTKSAFVFDGYGGGRGWDDYDGGKAGEALKKVGVSADVTRRPANTPTDWRRDTCKGLNADLVMVNSSGMRDFFELAGAKATCGDVPLLNRPSAVWFVHSWSAAQPHNRWTVAGRWLERGAFVYAGSVHEPFLQAFVPTPIVASGLASGVPIGMVIRTNTPPWRIAMIGDPLWTLQMGAGAVRGGELPDVVKRTGVSVDESMRTAVKAKDFAVAMRELVTLGRDKDAARLSAALLRDQSPLVTVAVAELAIGATFRAGEFEALFDLLPIVQPTMDKNQEKAADLYDMAWHASFLRAKALSDSAFAVLIKLIRGGGADQAGRDISELQQIAKAKGGDDRVRQMLEAIMRDAPLAEVKKRAEEDLKKMK